MLNQLITILSRHRVIHAINQWWLMIILNCIDKTRASTFILLRFVTSYLPFILPLSRIIFFAACIASAWRYNRPDEITRLSIDRGSNEVFIRQVEMRRHALPTFLSLTQKTTSCYRPTLCNPHRYPYRTCSATMLNFLWAWWALLPFLHLLYNPLCQ